MSTIEGVDYSYSHPTVDALVAAGKRFACRYLSTTPGKALTIGEARTLHDAGLSIVLNYEHNEQDALGGYAAGAGNASLAEGIRRAIQAPDDSVIYFSVDMLLTHEQWPALIEYFRGVADVIGPHRTGVYGGIDTCNVVYSTGYADWVWQTYAWSHGVWRSGNHIEQYRNGVPLGGGSVDLNRALTAHYGQWAPGGETDMDLADQFTIPNWDKDPRVPSPEEHTTVQTALAVAQQRSYLALRTAQEVEGKLDKLASTVDTALSAINGNLQELVNRGPVVVDATAIQQDLLKALREVAEDAVARTLRTAVNPADDDQADVSTSDTESRP
jgi:hypothetical protein